MKTRIKNQNEFLKEEIYQNLNKKILDLKLKLHIWTIKNNQKATIEMVFSQKMHDLLKRFFQIHIVKIDEKEIFSEVERTFFQLIKIFKP